MDRNNSGRGCMSAEFLLADGDTHPMDDGLQTVSNLGNDFMITSGDGTSVRCDPKHALKVDRVSAMSALKLANKQKKSVISGHGKGAVLRKPLIFALIGLAGMFTLAYVPMGVEKHKLPAQRCAGLLWLVSVYWASDCIPSHVTALFVPLLVVLLEVMRVPTVLSDALVPAKHCPHLNATDQEMYGKAGELLIASEAASVASAAFFDPVILLFMSGFTMAAALEKYGISKRVATELLRRAGTRPSRVLLALMFLGVTLSMWVSNVAAAVLNVAVISPLLRKLDSQATWPKTALLGIAYSCNIGGMTTPIASPQNVIALISLKKIAPEYQLAFLDWCYFAWPFCLVVIFMTWGWLRYMCPTNLPGGIPASAVELLLNESSSKKGRKSMDYSNNSYGSVNLEDQQEEEEEKFGLREAFIIVVIVITIALWIAFDQVKGVFGNLGIIGLIPCLAFYGTGLLNHDEFNSMPWSVLMLMGGGLCLGNAVQSSGLLDSISDSLSDGLDGQGLWLQFFVFNVVAGIVANFISSTVAAIIMLPVFAQVGLTQGHPRMFVISTAIMCSGAMGLPVSSFPNANSMAARAANGAPFLNNSDYVRTGFPMAFFILVTMCSFGFGYLLLLGW